MASPQAIHPEADNAHYQQRFTAPFLSATESCPANYLLPLLLLPPLLPPLPLLPPVLFELALEPDELFLVPLALPPDFWAMTVSPLRCAHNPLGERIVPKRLCTKKNMSDVAPCVLLLFSLNKSDTKVLHQAGLGRF
jgi:hypothetical protein